MNSTSAVSIVPHADKIQIIHLINNKYESCDKLFMHKNIIINVFTKETAIIHQSHFNSKADGFWRQKFKTETTQMDDQEFFKSSQISNTLKR